MQQGPQASSYRTSRTAIGILVVVLAIRLLAALFIIPTVTADAEGYEAAAIRVFETGSFAYPPMTSSYWETTSDGVLRVSQAGHALLGGIERNAYTMPGYPIVRAAVMAATPSDGPARIATRLLQALLSTLVAWVAYLLGRRFSERAGLLALLGCALYPPFTLANSYLLTEVVFTAVLIASVYAVVRWSDDLDTRWALAAGALFGVSLYIRPTMALWIPFAALCVVVARRSQVKKVLLQSALLGLVVIAVITPWWLRNGSIYDRFVPFTTGAAVTTIEAIRMDVDEPLPLPWRSSAPKPTVEQQRIAVYTRQILSGGQAVVRDESQLASYFAQETDALVARVRAEGLLPSLVGARARAVLMSVLRPHAVSPTALRGVPFTLAWAMQLVLLAAFALGVALAPRRLDTLLLISLPLYSLTIHAIVISYHRYHFPVMPLVVVIAAVGIDVALKRSQSAVTES
ncbi:MAG: glycosyltransferase family 39 protein [Coriobacteriia bacterium]|nr:glycosyltransferase family 39 protein [Coriobacteriia bacterium]